MSTSTLFAATSGFDSLTGGEVMVAQNIAFAIMAVTMLVSAVRMVTTRNVVHAALYLVIVLAGAAGIFILLGAEFVGVTQVMVYIGAIVVLFLFGIMLTNKISTAQISQSSVQKVLGLLVVLGIATIILTAVLPHDWVGATLPMAFTDTVTGIGTLLFTDYLILFEIASVLLLGALIGAATLARKEL